MNPLRHVVAWISNPAYRYWRGRADEAVKAYLDGDVDREVLGKLTHLACLAREDKL